MQKRNAISLLIPLPMKISNFNQGSLCVCLILLFASSASHAGIYKWVDANGQTHYSEKKKDAEKAKAVELRVKSEPQSAQEGSSPAKFFQEQEKHSKQRQKQNEKSSVPAEDERPTSLSGGRSDDTDISKCNLAKDVISGALRHSNGQPIDKYDLEIAENDVRTYCH
jgi:hypothetical protein